MGRRATVLSIWTGDFDATGLPEPLGLFLDPKNGIFFLLPAGGQPFEAGYTGHLVALGKVCLAVKRQHHQGDFQGWHTPGALNKKPM